MGARKHSARYRCLRVLATSRSRAILRKMPVVAAKKSARKTNAKPVAVKPSKKSLSVKNLPKGALKLTAWDYAADRLFTDDLPE